jgi:hypothetical protein
VTGVELASLPIERIVNKMQVTSNDDLIRINIKNVQSARLFFLLPINAIPSYPGPPKNRCTIERDLSSPLDPHENRRDEKGTGCQPCGRGEELV